MSVMETQGMTRPRKEEDADSGQSRWCVLGNQVRVDD